jgi:transcription elongation factor/antiterminator RfaH
MSAHDRPEALNQTPSQNFSAVLSDGQRWYAVHTAPMSEARAQAHLENQNFRTFLPRRRKTVRHARRMKTIEAPFFPRYLFVALDLTCHQWRRVNGTFGVSRMVMRGDEPCPVPRGIVETLIDSADGRGILQPCQQLKVGVSVRLIVGPFADQLAILDRLDDCGRVHVLLKLMGRQVSISTHCKDVLPVA